MKDNYSFVTGFVVGVMFSYCNLAGFTAGIITGCYVVRYYPNIITNVLPFFLPSKKSKVQRTITTGLIT